MTLLVVSASHRSAPIGLRERLAVDERRAAALLTALVESPAIDEAAWLSTCNRAELYLAGGDATAAATAARSTLARAAGMRPSALGAATRTVEGTGAARHLFRVTAGLESMIVGEAEIQGQVRRAYELALTLGSSGRIVNRLFQDALRAGKRVRTETGVSSRPASVASVAVELARRELGALHGRRAVVIGVGRHGALTARALMDAGVRAVFVAGRARERVEDLARRLGATAVGADDLARALRECDVLLSCSSCPYRVLTRRDIATAAEGRQLVVIDTAVPRDVEPSARHVPGVTLHDLDDIEREMGRNLSSREREARHAEPIVEAEVARFGRWLASLDAVPTITALHARGDAAVRRALRENEPRWRSLGDDDRERVERLARAVVRDLLHEPTLGLRRAGERGSSPVYVQTVRELFGLDA